METIKEKVLRAWAQEKRITVCFAMDSELTGYVSEFAGHAFEIRDTVRYTEKGVRRFFYHDITDICFVGEEKVELAEDGSILGDFQKERTAALSEMFDHQDEQTSIYQFFIRLDRAVEKALERQRLFYGYDKEAAALAADTSAYKTNYLHLEE